MRNRHIVSVLALLLILVLGVPAVAGGPNDNGNGMREVYVETQDFDTDLYMPICADGVQTGQLRQIPSHIHRVITIAGKADGSRVAYLLTGSNVSLDEAYRIDDREHQVVNSIDVGGTGLPNAYNQTVVRTWSDPDGVYAEETQVYHQRWDKDGNMTFDSHLSGLVCLRDTILP